MYKRQELAISESQERMACAIAASDVDEFLRYAREENLEATVVAEVTDDARVRVMWNDNAIICLLYTSRLGRTSMVSRIYVEKKPGFDVEAQQLAHELRSILGITSLEGLRLVNRYDVEGISQELFDQCVPTVFSEPQEMCIRDSPYTGRRRPARAGRQWQRRSSRCRTWCDGSGRTSRCRSS